MKKNDHVEFTGNLPKELKKAKRPVYGTILKLIGRNKAEIKPRYKRFTVSVALTDLTKVKDEKFTKKRTKKKVIAKNPTLKVVPKNEGVVKAVAKAKYPEPKDEVKVTVQDAEKKVAEVCDKIPFQFNEESLKNFEKKEDEKPFNWVKDDPINTKTPVDLYDDEVPNGKGAIVLPMIIIVVVLILVSYFVFF
jgi:hypothetical protein